MLLGLHGKRPQMSTASYDKQQAVVQVRDWLHQRHGVRGEKRIMKRSLPLINLNMISKFETNLECFITYTYSIRSAAIRTALTKVLNALVFR